MSAITLREQGGLLKSCSVDGRSTDRQLFLSLGNAQSIAHARSIIEQFRSNRFQETKRGGQSETSERRPAVHSGQASNRDTIHLVFCVPSYTKCTSGRV
jgi:hypothetical protein